MKPIKFLDLTPSPALRRELDAAYERVMSSGRYIGGYEVEAFEKEWAEYCQVDHCVACGNGFDALQLILRAYAIGDHGHLDEVIVPEWTAIPTWASVIATRAKPVTENVAILHRMVAIIIVHLYGIKMDFLPDTIVFIEDCAQAHGLKGIGKFGPCAWSFYPTKNLGAHGDGGAITTNSAELDEQLRLLSSYGCPGAINSRMDPLQAAFLRVKLPYLDGWNAHRREIAAMYLERLHEIALADLIDLPRVPDGCEPVWHQFVIQSPRRDHLRAFLLARGIETMIHYPVPPHRALGYDYDLPEADRLAREVLSLPVGPHLRDEEVDSVIEAIKEWADA